MVLTRTASDARPALRRGTVLAAWLAVLGVVCLLSVAIGTRAIAPATVWDALVHHGAGADQTVVRDLRVPRTVLGLLAGVAFGLSGAVIQAVTRNPLADTQILGINAGAGLFMVLAIGFLGRTDIDQYLWFGFGGVAFALVGVYALGSAGRGGATPIRLTLAGVALGAVLDGISAGVRLVRPRAFDYLRFWDAGTIAGRPIEVARTILPFVLAGAVLALLVAGSLNAVALGDDLARSLGANIGRTRLLAVLAVMLLTGAATAAAGPIGFIGLMVPQVVRRFAGPDQRWIFAYTVVCGPVLLLSADIVGRVVIRPGELPVGIVTAFVGAPVLIWWIRRAKVGTR
ncbi:iron chelate uptake ABC transporter family permease subunit [Paractinoplanes toevensis]|uniref:Iron ABC transporter permease n=1 Tax=Paractinoplanes toevensis TaxID=571911 RepID=A0A919T533_9ACTN|nr:iron chelate uptake ABC transporter family permease subunit [Actinoplanes toevensis]GIM89038.1 iron ABC transporter permease [Actinoplanes toevensis]